MMMMMMMMMKVALILLTDDDDDFDNHFTIDTEVGHNYQFTVNIVPHSSREQYDDNDDDDFIIQHCFMSHTFYEITITFY